MVQKSIHDLSFQPDLSFTTFSLHHSLYWSFCCSMYSPSIFLLQDICNGWSLPRKFFPSILVAHFFSFFMSLLKWHVVNNAFSDHSMRWQFLALAIHVHLACMCVKSLQSFQLFTTLCTMDGQAPLSMGFSRQEYWSGLPCPSPGDLPNPGIEPTSPALQVDSLFQISSFQFSHSVTSNSLPPHEIQHSRLPCPPPAPGACSNSRPLSQ